MPAGAAPGLPEPSLRFFADRSLGSRVVPEALRAAGWVLETMDERYGTEKSQLIKDVQWIGEATSRGDVLLAKDLRIARNSLEAMAIYQTSARLFALARRDIDGPTMARYYLSNEQPIFRMAARASGPYVVAVSLSRLHRVPLNIGSHRG